MKCKTMKHGNIGLQCMMLVFILAVCFSSCKDSKDDTSAPYDPNLPHGPKCCDKDCCTNSIPVSLPSV